MNFFSNALVGQLVVLASLLMVTLRPILKKSRNMETMAFISAIAFICTILLILIFGISLLLLLNLGLSLIVLISNIASMYRLTQGLYSDSHSSLFSVVSYIEAFLIVLFIVLIVVFRPMSYNADVQNKELFTGSFSRGFTEKTGLLERTNLIVTEYSLSNIANPEDDNLAEEGLVVVYVSPVGVTSLDAALRLTTAAEMGLTLLTGDFFASDAPKTNTQIDSPLNNNPILAPYTLHFLPKLNEQQKNVFLEKKELELEALLSIAGQKFSSAVIVAEGDLTPIALEMKKKYPNFVIDVFSVTKDANVNTYYDQGLADLVLLNPFDARFSKFESAREYNEFNEYAKTEKPHLRFARLLTEKVSNLLQEK